MAGAAIKVDAQELLEWIGAVKARNANLEPVFAVIAEALVTAVSDEFDSAGHGKWPPLAESTKKKRRGSSYQILKNTGALAGSIQPFFGENFAEASTDLDYAVYHVSDAPRSRLPLRNFFDVPDEVLEEARDQVIAAILGE